MAHLTDSAPRSFSFEPLTPTSFLARSARVFADRIAVVDDAGRWTYVELHRRACQLAGALAKMGVGPGDRVAVLAPNTHVVLEAHYGIPYAGAVLVPLNTRLAAAELAFIIEHSGARVLLVDAAYAPVAATATAQLTEPPMLIESGEFYETLLAEADMIQVPVADERDLISLNYTSGTTGTPKGVMYHHRGAYLQSLAMVTHFNLDAESRYLWTLPMFHCNGWCFTWAVTAAGGTHVCLPEVDPQRIWNSIRSEGVTHFCAAPTVLTSLLEAPAASSRARDTSEAQVTVAVGGAPPTPRLLERSASAGLAVTHLYGLTETFGPIAICDWRTEWDELSPGDQARVRARQGVGNVISCELRVIDRRGSDVPHDGVCLGEIVVRGNNVMSGYYRDQAATDHAVQDGWLRTGDLGVMHSDGYVELKDRSKDVIVSGGENISSVEVEAALSGHPDVLEAAVVGVPHDKWGERPAALVSLRPGATASADDIREYLRGRIARFKVPDEIRFGALPKTATGKIQKFRLRKEWNRA